MEVQETRVACPDCGDAAVYNIVLCPRCGGLTCSNCVGTTDHFPVCDG